MYGVINHSVKQVRMACVRSACRFATDVSFFGARMLLRMESDLSASVPEQLVLEKFGPAAWEDIIVDAGFKKEEAWVLTDYYSDGDTVNIVVAAAAKLGVDAGAVLEIYGSYFPHFLIENQLDKMLHLMGNNLKDFLYNLDYLQ